MNGNWTWSGFFQSLLGVLQWTIAVVSVAGTVGLFSWIVIMVVRKDKAK
jgi:hypothetical protein